MPKLAHFYATNGSFLTPNYFALSKEVHFFLRNIHKKQRLWDELQQAAEEQHTKKPLRWHDRMFDSRFMDSVANAKILEDNLKIEGSDLYGLVEHVNFTEKSFTDVND